jgi:hypothetical protein
MPAVRRGVSGSRNKQRAITTTVLQHAMSWQGGEEATINVRAVR